MCGADGWTPDIVSCDDLAPGLCWPCLMDFLLVLDDLPLVFSDLDVGMTSGLDGAAEAYQELVRALEGFAVGWLDLEHDDCTDLDVWSVASTLREARVSPRMLRPAVLALAAIDYLYSNVDEPELRTFARDVTTASFQARAVIFIPRGEEQP